MSNAMTYKGYQARIEYDDDDQIFWGRLAGIHDVVSFHADSVEALRAAFEEAVDDYLDICAKRGKEPQKPYSGKVMFRVAPETHRRAAIAAELAGKSLNQWAEELIEKATRELESDDTQDAA
ncbi:MAG: type II toxin-antitoxin system HicB family antitoxin [Methyloceanibacter sp.]|nr:type II toxin-antitoxin system HicB family antitoxin [Methyloceanibacter sp.]